MTAIRPSITKGALFALIFMNMAFAQTTSGAAQNISIVQGNGQLVCDGCVGANYSFDDLVVAVTDANGVAVNNATVNWTVTDADGIRPPNGTFTNGETTATTMTYTSGAAGGLCSQGTCERYGGNDTGGTTLRVMAVTASLTNGQSVTFTLTETPNEESANVVVTSPATNTLFEGTANSTSSMPITVTVSTNGGQGIPNVSVRLVAVEGNGFVNFPTANCATQAGADSGSILTNSAGLATCNVVFGPAPSTGQAPNYNPSYFRILVGGVVFPLYPQNYSSAVTLGLGGANGFAAPPNARYELIVPPATPAAVQIIGGNFQCANGGKAIPSPLTLQVVDGSSPPKPVLYALVTWSVVPAGAAAVTPQSPTTDSNGESYAAVVLASTAAGLVQVTATTANGLTVTFSLSVNAPVTITGLALVPPGNNQSASVGQYFGIDVQVSVASGQSRCGIPVNFAVTSGSASITESSATTDASGLAQVGVQAGTTPGPVVVTASVGRFSVAVNLTVLPPGPSLTSANLLNGAGFFATGDKNSGALSPCSIGTVVLGTPLTPATLPAVPALFGVAMQEPSGASVIFNPATAPDQAPILNVTGVNTAQTLITFQVPCDVTPSSAVPVSVTLSNSTTPTAVNLDIRSASPGVFELPMSDGVRRAVAVRPDGTFVSLTNPARRGEIIKIYITGIGPTSPALTTNALPAPGVDSLSTAAYLAVQVGNQEGMEGVPVLSSSHVSPSLIGVFELEFAIPADALQGNNTSLLMGVLVTSTGDYQFAQPGIGSRIPIQ